MTQNQKFIDSLINDYENQKNDTLKIKTLNLLHAKLMFSKPEESKTFAEKSLDLSKKLDYTLGIANGNRQMGNYFYNRSEFDSAKHYYNIAKEKYIQLNDQTGLIRLNHILTDIKRLNGDLEDALSLSLENIALLENTSNTNLENKFLGALYDGLGKIYMDMGSFNLALKETLKAVKFYEKNNDKVRKADALKQMGDLDQALKNHESAIKNFNTAIKIYDEFNDKMYKSYALNSAGLAYQDLNKYDKAIQYQKEAIRLGEEVGNNAALISALNSLGDLYIIKKDYSQAKELYQKAKTISEGQGMKFNTAHSLLGLTKVEFLSSNYQKALNILDSQIKILEPIGALNRLMESYNLRSEILEALNRNSEAIIYLKLHKKTTDSVFSLEKNKQIEELKTIYETEKKEAQIALQNEAIKTLNIQAENDKLTKTLYGIGMFSFIAIAGLLYFGFKQRIKKNRMAREKQEAIYKQEIEFKKKELASQTLHLVQKSTFIQELKENLEKIKRSPELFKVEFRRLVMLLKKESAEDKDWEIFKSYFSEVHNNFDNKLKAIYAEITEKEIRLASFLRMNLSTKEIASMLNVLPESVLKSKYRLKKKLNLDKETDLNSFLNSM